MIGDLCRIQRKIFKYKDKKIPKKIFIQAVGFFPSFFQFGKKEGKNVTPCMVKWHLCFKLTIEVGLLNPIVMLIG